MVTVRTESPLNGFAAALRLKLRHLNLASPTHESRVVPNSIAPDPFLIRVASWLAAAAMECFSWTPRVPALASVWR